MPLNYSFFADQGETPQTLQERRLKADMLAGQIGRDNTYGGGIGDLFRGLGAGLSRYRTGQAQKKGDASAKSGMDKLMELMYAPPANQNAGSGATSPASNDAVKQKVFNALSGLGYTPAQIAGIAGNLQQESSFNPTIEGDNGASYGLAQWQGPRRAALQQFAAERGADAGDPEVQAQFLHHELQTTESRAGELLRAATTPQEATDAMLAYERPQGYSADNPAGSHGYANRQANAMAMVPQLATYTPPQPAGGPMQQAPQMPAQAPPAVDPAQSMAPAQQAATAQMQPANNEAALIPQIMEMLRNPFLPEQDKAFLQNRLEDIQKKADPVYQMGLEKSQLELNDLKKPKLEHWQDPNTGDFYSYDARDPENTMKLVQKAGAKPPGSGDEMGLTQAWWKDAEGKIHASQLSKSGGMSELKLPPGATWLPGVQPLDTGLGYVPLNKRTGLPEPGAPVIPKDVAGEAAAKEVGAVQGKQTAAAPSDVAAADMALNLIDQIATDPNLDWGVGMTSIGNMIPGTPGRDFQSRVDQAKSGAFLSAIQQLRGMGSLSNAEGDTATKAVTRLNTATSKEEFLSALRDYKDIVRVGRERAAARIPGGASLPEKPEDISPDLWNEMTPEQKSLWK